MLDKQNNRTKHSAKKATSLLRDTVSLSVRKLLDKKTISKEIVHELHSKIKMFEFSGIKNLDTLRISLNVVNTKMKDRLNMADLNSKQRAEILLAAQIEAYAIVESLVGSIEKQGEF